MKPETWDREAAAAMIEKHNRLREQREDELFAELFERLLRVNDVVSEITNSKPSPDALCVAAAILTVKGDN